MAATLFLIYKSREINSKIRGNKYENFDSYYFILIYFENGRLEIKWIIMKHNIIDKFKLEKKKIK